MDKEALAKQSPMSLLGLPETGPDLLDEVMKGRVETPGNNFSKGFGGAKETAFDEFAKAAPIGTPDSVKESIAEKESPEQVQQQDEGEKAGSQDFEETTETTDEATSEKLPEYFHSLNEQHEQIRQRQSAIEQALREQQRRDQMYQQYIQNTTQRQQQNQQQQQQQQEDYSWAEKGFESPEQYKAFENEIRSKARQEALQIFEQQNAPMVQQMATDRFSAAVNRCAKDYEHFEKYFPRDALNSYFTHIVQKFGTKVAASMDFDQEFSAAYKVRDYERLSGLLAKDEQRNKANGQTQKDERQERKADLKLVPKASQAGAPASKKTLNDEIAEMGKVSVRDVGRHLRSRLFAQ